MHCADPAAAVTFNAQINASVAEIVNCRPSLATDTSSKELTVCSSPSCRASSDIVFVSCDYLLIQLDSGQALPNRRFCRASEQQISLDWLGLCRPLERAVNLGCCFGPAR